MKKTLLVPWLLLVVAMLSGCADFDNSSYRTDRYNGGSGSGGGHSHH